LKILIVTQYFWPENFRINDLALGLRDRGHEVTVYTGKPNYPDGEFFAGYGFFGRARDDYRGVPIIRVPLIPRGRGGSFRLALNYFSFALFASLLAPWRCRGQFDAIVVFEPSPVTVGLPALVLKKLKRAPVLFWVQDLWPESLAATGAVRSNRVLNAVARLVRFIYSGCDLILVQSEAFVEPIRKFGIAHDRIRYYPNSAEALYRPVAAAAGAPGLDEFPAGFRVMFAGSIGAAQDFETILAAAERLKTCSDIHWMILGDGRLLTWVAAEIGRRGLASTVHVLGRHPLESMPGFFAFADVMLVTLKKEPIFALTIPAKVQSYLACAKPIVAALDGEGARVVVDAGAGLAVAAENPTALAEAVLTMYRMEPDKRLAMGQSGRDYFERHFERDMLIRKLEHWMNELRAN
jgi:colanic acid biosynthesis glycosyl transferase WcaI